MNKGSWMDGWMDGNTQAGETKAARQEGGTTTEPCLLIDPRHSRPVRGNSRVVGEEETSSSSSDDNKATLFTHVEVPFDQEPMNRKEETKRAEAVRWSREPVDLLNQQ